MAGIMGLVQDISAALLATLSYDPNVRQPAEAHLAQFAEANFPGYMASLIAELGNDSRDAGVRQAAGLLLKNAVDAKDEARRKQLNQRWAAVDPTVKQSIREVLLQCLHSPVLDVRRTTALVVAKVGGIDLQIKEWPTLVQSLLNNMGAQPPVPGTRQATLMTLGFLCEEVGDDTLDASEVNLILTAIVAGMGPSEADESRLAAIQALTNAIRFARSNFSVDNERNYLMQVVCQGTQAANVEIRKASFECLHEIADNYYDKLVPYMTELYNLTVKAMKEDIDDVACQAVEFWSTVTDYEQELLDDGQEAQCHNFLRQASQYLVPVLLELMTKQEDDQDDDNSWNKSKAAGVCLDLMAKCIKDHIVPLVLPFVTANITKAEKPDDWHLREAATLAFGSIMDGPNPSSLDQIVRQGLPCLLSAIKDPHPYVKETTAWTLAQIFKFVHGSEGPGVPPLVSPDLLRQLVAVLLEALRDPNSQVAKRVCEAFMHLASGFDCADAETSPLSPYFRDVVQALFECAERHQGGDHHANVNVSAYESINEIVSSSARDTLPMVAALLAVVLEQIEKTLALVAGSTEMQERISTLQGLFCGMLATAVEKLSRKDDSKPALAPHADRIFATLLRVLSGGKGHTVHEGAMLAMGVFVQALGDEFLKYMNDFYDYLKTGLQHHQEWQVCLSTVGVLGDLTRALGPALLPKCDEIVHILLTNLGSAEVHRDIKPELMVTVGDLALGIEAAFAKYLDAVRGMLSGAMLTSIAMAQDSAANEDFDAYDYNCNLRRGIINAYSLILQGLGDEVKDNAHGLSAELKAKLLEEVPKIIGFVSSIAADKTVQEDDMDFGVARAAVSLLGDVTIVLQESWPALRSSPRTEWHSLVKAVKDSGSGDSNDAAWAVGQLEQATGKRF